MVYRKEDIREVSLLLYFHVDPSLSRAHDLSGTRIDVA